MLEYGAIVQSILAPGRDGSIADVVLGYDTLDGYLADTHYLGAIVGRYCNRVADASFRLDGRDYELTANDGRNHLHGGGAGFDKALWHGQAFATKRGTGVRLDLTSPDGDEGYPGRLDVAATYLLDEDNRLLLSFEATTDSPTHVNLTNHSYFNLRGSGDVLDHRLEVRAGHYLPVDDALIPTGELAPVEDTPFDFTTPTRVGDRIDAPFEQIRRGRGYDHSLVLQSSVRDDCPVVATLVDPASGRRLDIATTEPAVQIYTANVLTSSSRAKGRRLGARSGLCLETQHFPDAPNQSGFPSTVLRPGETYHSRSVYRFGVAP